MLKFTKMCASGNDFIVVDNRSGSYPDGAALAQRLCRRSYSVGADGLLLLENGKSGKLKMRILNPDGSEAEMCGNGARCIAAFCYREKIANRKVNFETLAGLIEAEVIGNVIKTPTHLFPPLIHFTPPLIKGTVEIKEGEGNSCPRSSEKVKEEVGRNSCKVKLKMGNPSGIELSFNMIIDGEKYMMSFINTGVPHTVLIMESVENIDVGTLGRKIRYHKKFQSEGTNVDFVELVDREKIRIRTYERGVEWETLACGTGAVASALICHLLGKVNPPVSVETGGGSTLKVHFVTHLSSLLSGEDKGNEGYLKADGEITNVYLQGDASFVYEGTLSSSKM